MAAKSDIIVGLDIGTTKVCALIGEVKPGGTVEMIGVGTHPSRGLKKGVVVNIEATVDSIRKAIKEAETMAGCQVRSAFVGVSGAHIQSKNVQGMITIKNHNEITELDIARAIDSATALATEPDRETIHAIPQEFVVDEQDGIKEPLGMSGTRLEVKVHVITAATTAISNLAKCVELAGIGIDDIILQQIASSEAVLSPDEQSVGVALVDIGGGTSDIAIFYDGSIRHTAIIPLGGNNITNDIAIMLKTQLNESEKIKIRYGKALSLDLDASEIFDIQSAMGRKDRSESRRYLAEIIESRLTEIFEAVNREIVKSGYGSVISSGIVLTGGTAALDGIEELAERIFGLGARRGIPSGISGLADIIDKPSYATGVGLILWGGNNLGSPSPGSYRAGTDGNLIGNIKDKVRGWFGGAGDFFSK